MKTKLPKLPLVLEYPKAFASADYFLHFQDWRKEIDVWKSDVVKEQTLLWHMLYDITQAMELGFDYQSSAARNPDDLLRRAKAVLRGDE